MIYRIAGCQMMPSEDIEISRERFRKAAKEAADGGVLPLGLLRSLRKSGSDRCGREKGLVESDPKAENENLIIITSGNFEQGQFGYSNAQNPHFQDFLKGENAGWLLQFVQKSETKRKKS